MNRLSAICWFLSSVSTRASSTSRSRPVRPHSSANIFTRSSGEGTGASGSLGALVRLKSPPTAISTMTRAIPATSRAITAETGNVERWMAPVSSTAPLSSILPKGAQNAGCRVPGARRQKVSR